MSELQQTIDDLNTAWHSYKSVNDERIKNIEKTGQDLEADRAKLAAIEKDMDQLEELKSRLEQAELKLDTPEFSKGATGKAEAEHLKAFEDMVRGVKFGQTAFDRDKEQAYVQSAKAVSIGTA